jgi:hypothetical protein
MKLVPDPQDIVEIEGVHSSRPGNQADPMAGDLKRRFLSIWFRCCHVYGRIYRNASQTAYEGRCPRCGAAVQALIGPGGTDRRMFEAS